MQERCGGGDGCRLLLRRLFCRVAASFNMSVNPEASRCAGSRRVPRALGTVVDFRSLQSALPIHALTNQVHMFGKLFRRNQSQSNSPMVRDTLRRISGVVDDSPTGRAIQNTELVMARASTAIGHNVLNENDATKEASVYFLTGVAIGYCQKYGVSDTEDIRAVVRCAMRSWIKAPAGADALADGLDAYLADEVFAGPVMDFGGSSVLSKNEGLEEIVRIFHSCLVKWRTFDVDAHVI